jgi:hypothetical protein
MSKHFRVKSVNIRLKGKTIVFMGLSKYFIPVNSGLKIF